MRTLLAIAVLLAACADGAPEFVAVDVFVEAGDGALAAYQVDLHCPRATVVGVEGGDAPFAEPPHYDPAALRGGRIVLAALLPDAAPDTLPRGRVRIARLHLLEPGPLHGPYRALAATGARPDGARAAVEVAFEPLPIQPR